MPVILRVRGFRFWFYSIDLVEPPHMHVGRAGNEAKFWLSPIALARSRGFRDHELRTIEALVNEHQSYLLAAWQQAKSDRYDDQG